jgi:hypothetical protein
MSLEKRTSEAVHTSLVYFHLKVIPFLPPDLVCVQSKSRSFALSVRWTVYLVTPAEEKTVPRFVITIWKLSVHYCCRCRVERSKERYCDKNIGEFVAGKLTIRDSLERFEHFPAELCVLSKEKIERALLLLPDHVARY